MALRLTPTSYIVLGLLELGGEATPYELKAMVAQTVGDFWTLQHAQLYSEPTRLADAGLVEEHREEGGRRRKRYRLTQAGRAALEAWRADPTDAFTELRDPGLLQLFFGTDKRQLAERQLAAHEAKLAEYEDKPQDGMTPALRTVLRCGLGHEREWVRFWQSVLDEARG